MRIPIVGLYEIFFNVMILPEQPQNLKSTDIDAIARCEAFIDEARRGDAAQVECDTRRWRAEVMATGNAQQVYLATHALASSLLIQSRGAEAIPLLVEVTQAARETNDLDRYVRALVQSASALAGMGAHHRALELLIDASRLADDSVSARAHYTLHSVRARIEFLGRDYDQALAHAATAQQHADREQGGVSSLINRWHTAEIRFAQAIDAIRLGDDAGVEQLAVAADDLAATAHDADTAQVARVAICCYAVGAFAAIWRGDCNFARKILAAQQQSYLAHPSVDVRFRFACAETALRLADGKSDAAEIDALFDRHQSAPLVVRIMWARLVGDVASAKDNMPVADCAYRRALMLHDSLASELNVGLAAVTRLRSDLDQLRDTAHAALTELSAARNGRDTLEAQVLHLQMETTIDPLTKLINRRGLEARFNIWDHSPAAEPLTLAFVDIDFFKQINDTQGHATGDRVLAAVADAMRREVRDEDVIARYAGDEFLVVFPAPLPIAVSVCERLMQRLPCAAQSDIGTGVLPTLSIGIAARRAGETMQSLQARADAALYRAKQGGRARYCVAED